MVVSASINKYIYGIVTKNFDTTFQAISADYRTTVLNMPTTEGAVAQGDAGEMRLAQAVYEYFDLRLPINVFIASEVPPGTGLGSSGSAAAMLSTVFSALTNQGMNKQEIAEAAYTIETERLQAPVGKQDQYGAAYGGLNCFEFSADGVKVSPLRMSGSTVRKLERRLMLFYTGATRQARTILQEQRDNSDRSSGRTIDALHQIKALGWQIKDAIEQGRLDDFGLMLDESWQYKKSLATGVTNSFIDSAYEAARSQGVLGGKITGAGGGGFLMLYCHEDHQDGVRAALADLGLQQMRYAFEFEGARVLLHTTMLSTPFDWND